MGIAAGPGSLVRDTGLVMCQAGFVAVMMVTRCCLCAEYEKRQRALIVFFFFLVPRRNLRGFATCVESEFMSSRAVGRAGSTLCGMNHVFAVVLAGKELRRARLIAALVGDCVAPRRRENPKICLWLPAAFKICFAALIRILFFSSFEGEFVLKRTCPLYAPPDERFSPEIT